MKNYRNSRHALCLLAIPFIGIMISIASPVAAEVFIIDFKFLASVSGCTDHIVPDGE